jgi:hypothetical protein
MYERTSFSVGNGRFGMVTSASARHG